MITAETLRAIPLFAALPTSEQAVIASRTAEVTLQDGEWLIHEGETASFFALVSGRLAVMKSSAGVDRVIDTYVPGDYFGEVPLLLSSVALAGLRALEASRVLRLDAADFRELIVGCANLREVVLRTMAQRVLNLQRIAIEAPVANVTLVGSRLDLECHNLREFLARNHVAYTWLEPDAAATSLLLPAELRTHSRYPFVAFTDGSHLDEPSFRDVAERLGLATVPNSSEPYDVAIIGAGPAGLAAAVYGASEGLKTVLIERESPGGQAGSSSRIENYLGFPTGVSGDDLSERAWQQATRFGAELLVARTLTGVDAGSGGAPHVITLDDGERVAARAIVIATGVAWRKLHAEGIEPLVGRGVYYGAARTEALETRGTDVFLVGGGNSAGQAAMFFANYARTVTLLVRGTSLDASMSQYLIAQLATKANVRVETNCRVVAARGGQHLESIVVEGGDGNDRREFATQALFLLIGADAETGIYPAAVVRDDRNFICTGRDMLDLDTRSDSRWPLERDPYLLETSIPGIFAAGDVRHGSIKRVASGVGEGSMSITFVHRFLEETIGSVVSSAEGA